jgi:hypothetical protein
VTALDVLVSADALALLAAIDEGHDDCLPILADLLEEAGDARATYWMRQPNHAAPILHAMTAEPRWGWLKGCWANGRAGLGESVYDLLAGWSEYGGRGGRYYPTRSAAYLALAEALAELLSDA